MSLIVPLFFVSLLGGVGILLRKIFFLKRENAVIVASAYSTDRISIAIRDAAVSLAARLRSWFSISVLPIFIHIAQILFLTTLFLVRKIQARLEKIAKERRNDISRKKGAASFFLKNISEHKKSLNGVDRNGA